MRIVWRLLYPVVVYDMITAMICLVRPDAEPLAAQGVSAAIAAAILFPAYLATRRKDAESSGLSHGTGMLFKGKDPESGKPGRDGAPPEAFRRKSRELGKNGRDGRGDLAAFGGKSRELGKNGRDGRGDLAVSGAKSRIPVRIVVLAAAGIAVSLCLNCLILAGAAAGLIPGYSEVTRLIYHPPLWRQIICAGFLIPVTEELVFRGIGYEALRERWSWPAAAAVIGILFGLYHGNPVQGTYAFLVTFLLVWSRETCGGLGAAVTVHMAANLAAIAGEAAGLARCRDRGTLLLLAAVSGFCLWMAVKWMRSEAVRNL